MSGDPDRVGLVGRRTGRRACLLWCLLLLLLSPRLDACAGEPAGEAQPAARDAPPLRLEIPPVFDASKYDQQRIDASKTDRQAGDIPALVSIVTADEIKKYGHRTLAAILQSLGGFYVTADRNYSYLGVRGFGRPGDYNTRVLLLLDGHRLNENVYDGALIGSEAILDVDLIERLEVVRGPGSALYGSNAFFAVVNIITKRGRDFQGVEASGAYGSFRTFTGRLTGGYRFQGGAELLLSATSYDSHGAARLYFPAYDTPATNHGYATDRDGDESVSLFAKLAFGDLSLQGAYANRKKELPSGSYGTVFNDPRARTTDLQGYVELKYDWEIAPAWGGVARLYYHRYNYWGAYPFDYPPVTLNRDRTFGEWWGGELRLSSRSISRHALTGGLEFQENLRQEQRNYDDDPYVLYLDDRRRSRNFGVYLQDEIELLAGLALVLGGRYDYYQGVGGTANPRLGLIYRPFESTALKLLFGQAFRAPNVYERFYGEMLTAKPNPALKAERITSYELVLEQDLPRAIRATASAFHHRIANLINQEVDPADGLLVFRNVGPSSTLGAEVGLEGRWGSGWSGRLSYATQWTQDDRTGEQLTNSPEHMAKLSLIAPLWRDRLFAGLEVQFMGDRRSLPGGEAKRHAVTNLTLFSANVLRGLEFSAGAYNLFDARYSDPVGGEHPIPSLRQDGRSFRVKLTYGY